MRQRAHIFLKKLLLLLVLVVLTFGMTEKSYAVIYTVNTTVDAGVGSLREAITQSNVSPGKDTIYFNIPGPGPHRILVNPQLPAIDQPLIIDGTTQNTFQGAPLSKRLIEIDGSISGGGIGMILQSNADSCVIKHLVINNFVSGLGITMTGVDRCQILGCYIGTDTTGMVDMGNLNGIEIHTAAKYNQIGGSGAFENCIISGNNGFGLKFQGGGTDSNFATNCIIGLAADGNADIGNNSDGVIFENSSRYNYVSNSVISGNNGSGVYYSGGGTEFNQVFGSKVGTDISGLIDRGNDQHGFHLRFTCKDNIVGGETKSHRNIISGNGQYGVYITGSATDRTLVRNNFIGVDVTGMAALPNSLSGVRIEAASEFTRIGGPDGNQGNVISGNGQYGIVIDDNQTDSNYVQGNLIGTDSTGNGAIPNTLSGVHIENGAQQNMIGGSTVGARNVISGNLEHGIELRNTNTLDNVIRGNYIGLGLSGTIAVPNTFNGVYAHDNADNIYLGGVGANEGNVISGNTLSGIRFTSNISNCYIYGNYVGTNAAGIGFVRNMQHGIYFDNNCTNNNVGGVLANQGNVISGNNMDGIYLDNADNSFVQGNYIGLDATGNGAVANLGNGLSLVNGCNNDLIGGDGPSAGNYIGGNNGNGILLLNGGTTNNLFYANVIGRNVSNSCAGNGGHGIRIENNTSLNTFGGQGDSLNVISCNGGDGVSIITTSALRHQITRNSIYANGGLGIDLNDDGPDTNDSGDPDSGPNDEQNYPVIDSAIANAGNITIYGKLNSLPGQNFTVEFYSNDVVDGTGYGEGKTYLGSASGLTNGSGDFIFSPTFTAVAGEPYISGLSYQIGVEASSEFSLISEATFDPIVSDDYYVLYEDEGIRFIPVLSNDVIGIEDFDTSTVQVLINPINGVSVPQPDGTISYTPSAGYYGLDSLEYRVCDKSTPTALCDTGWVRLSVAPRHDIIMTGGFRHTIVGCVDGSAYGTGQNSMGQVGQGTFNGQIVPPTQVLNEAGTLPYTNFKWIDGSSANHNLAITQGDSLLAWGNDGTDALGTTGIANSNIPVKVENVGGSGNGYLKNILDAAGTNNSSAAVLNTTGRVLTWGENNEGEHGDGTSGGGAATPDSSIINNVVMIDGGEDHFIALKRDGTVWGWGRNDLGQVGQSDLANPKSTPVQVQDLSDPTGFLSGVRKIEVGGNRNIALKWDGTLVGWGVNSIGEIGDGTTVGQRTSVVSVVDIGGSGQLDSVADVYCGTEHCLALLENGDVVSWGGNNFGELGDGTHNNRDEPDYVWTAAGNTVKLTNIVQIGGPEDGSFAIANDGTMYSWGFNGDAGLMLGFTGADVLYPTVVSGLGTCISSNSPPVAVKDSFSIDENDISQGLNVVTNDTDVDGDLDISSVTVLVGPNHGTVDSISSTGLIYYTPNPNFAGIDTIVYQVCDLTVACDDDTLIVYVNLQHGPGGVIDGLSTWFKADYGTTLSTFRVDEWQNRANGNLLPVVRQGTEPQLVNNGMNFNPYIEFDGTDNLSVDYLGVNFLNTSNNSSFIVTDYQSGNVLWTTQEISTSNRISLESDDNIHFRFDYPTSISQNLSTIPINDGPHIVHLVTDATTDSLLIDGQFNSSNAGGSLNTSVTYEYSFGALQNLSFFSTANIPEQILFSKKLTPIEENKVETYLAIKYGQTLGDVTNPISYTSSNGSTIWSADANYQIDIAGLGRDDIEELDQTISKSINPTALITIDHGGSLVADGDYLVWGHNSNGINSRTASLPVGAPGGVDRWMYRSWKVVETGTVGNVTLSIPSTALANFDDGQTIYLLSADDANFTINPVYSAMTINGASHEIASNIDGTKYFTFAGSSLSTAGIGLVHVSDAHNGAGTGISVWESNGDGTFGPCKVFTGNLDRDDQGTEASGVNSDQYTYFNDFNDDGIIDMAHTSNDNSNSIYVWLGNGDGTFQTTSIGTTGINTTGVTDGLAGFSTNEQSWFADVTSDGSIDYIFSNNNDEVFVWTGNGDGTFNGGVFIQSNLNGDASYGTSGVGNQQFFDLLDINNDGVLDIVGAHENDGNSIDVFFGNGDGTFVSDPVITSGMDNTGVGGAVFAGYNDNELSSFIDLNNDGNLDYVFINTGDNEVFVWFGNGDGTFSLGPPLITTGFTLPFASFTGVDNTQYAQIIDVTNDDIPDYVMANDVQSDSNGVYVYLGNGDGTFQTTYVATNIGVDNIRAFDVGMASEEFTMLAPIFNATPTYDALACNAVVPGGVSEDLRVWFRADTGAVTTINGADNSLWIDQSGSEFDATAGTGQANFLSSSMNFNPSLEFTAANLDQYRFFRPTESNMTYFVAFKTHQSDGSGVTNWYNGYGVVDGEVLTSTDDFGLAIAGGRALHGTGNPDFTIGSNDTINDGITNLISTTRNMSAGQLSMYIDGLLDTTRSGGNTGTLDVVKELTIGSMQLDNNYFNGEIAEVIAYDQDMSAADRSKVESYLAIKYGVTLGNISNPVNYVSSNGTLVWTSNVVYQNDIAGIAQDDISGLIQPRSASVNPSAVVEMSQPAHLGDGEYMIWGNNGLDMDQTQSADVPAGFNNRLQKIWRVDKLNDPGVVTVKINIADLPVTSINSADYALLISNTTTFAAAPILNPTGISGDTLTFSGIGFADDDFFTLAFNTTAPGGVSDRLNLWLKADVGVLNGVSSASDGQAVNTWEDQSGRRINDATDTNMAPPSYSSSYIENINFNPTVYFDGVDDGLNLFDDYIYSDNDGLTAFSVIKPDTNSAKTTALVYDFGLFSANGYGMYYQNTHMRTYGVGSVTGQVNHSYNDKPVVTTNIFDFGNSIDQYINNNEFDSEPFATTHFDSANIRSNPIPLGGDGPFTIGRQSKNNNLGSNGGRLFQGKIAEMIVYTKRITTAEKNRVESYLAIKYGITKNGDYITSDGSLVWDSTTYTTHHNDIVGIGRDDAQGLNQSISKSVNDSTMLTLQLGGLTDGSFAVCGNNGVSPLSLNTTTVPTGYYQRLNRTWVVQESGSVGPMTFKFDLSQTPWTSRDPLDYGIRVSNLQNFTGGAIGASSISGDTLIFNSLGLASGDYFTIATRQKGPGGVIVGLELWLKANEGTNTTTDGGVITSWLDQSGTNNHSSNGSGTVNYFSNASERFNFNPTIRFDNISDRLDGTRVLNDTGDSTLSSFFVLKDRGTATDFYNYFNFSGNSLEHRLEARTIGRPIAYYDQSLTGNLNAGVPDTFIANISPVLVSGIYDGSNYRIRGNEFLGDTRTLSDGIDIDGGTNYTIGQASSGDVAPGINSADFSVGEIISYNNNITDFERVKVSSYLSLKYGITMNGNYYSANDVLLWDTIINSVYHNDVAGIGQDDRQELIQTKSISSNDSSVLIVGGANALDDGDFLVWGNNGLPVDSLVQTEIPTGYTDRLAKVWKVAETGEVGNVEMKFLLTNYVGHLTDPTDYALLIHNGTDFENATPQTVGLSYDSDTLIVNSAAFNDGDYFTLALVINTAPIAVNDTVFFNEDTMSAGINVLVNDLDVNIDTTSISLVPTTGTFNGVVDSISNGVIYYTPNTNFNGIDSVDYRVCDLGGLCDTARVYLNINPVIDTIVALNDTLNITEDDPLTNILVIANDTDADGDLDPTTISIITGAANGISNVQLNGSIDYTPNQDFNGTDTVFYRICDSNPICDSAHLFINVAPLDDNPVAINDTIFVSQGGGGTSAVYLNDTDVDGDLDQNSVINLSGTTVNGASASNTGTGFVNVDYSGVPAFVGWDSVQYQICDGQPICVTAWLLVNVSNGNPPIAGTDSLVITEDTTFAGINVTLDDTDPDGNLDTSTVAILSGPINGTINSVSGFAVVYTPDPNWFGTDTIIYQIQDSTLLSDTDTLFVIVTPVEDTPVVNHDTITIPEDTTLVNTVVVSNDTDGDGNLDISSINILSGPFNGIGGTQPDGSLDYTPNLNYNGPDSIFYEVCDLTLRCDSAYLFITVTPVADTPVAVIDTIYVAQGGVGNASVYINDIDVDGDLDSNTVTTLTGTSVNGGSASAVNGILTIDYSVVPAFVGWDSIQYRICDATALCDTTWLYINVQAGSPPIAGTDSLIITEDTTFVTFNVLLDDTDPDGNIDTSTISIVQGPSFGTLGTVDGFGIQYQPLPDSNGTDYVVYSICDSTALCDQDTLFIIVTPVDDAPIANRDSIFGSQTTLVSHVVTNNDTDVDGNLDTSTVTIITPTVSGATAVVDGQGQISIDYSTQPLFTGFDSLQYRVCDATALCDSAYFVVNVQVFVPFTLTPDTIWFQEGCADIVQDILTNDNLATADIDSSTIAITYISPALIPVDSLYINNMTGELHVDYLSNLVGSGTDNITYRMCNQLGICDSTTVTFIRQPSVAFTGLDFSIKMLQLGNTTFDITNYISGADMDLSTLSIDGGATINFGGISDTLGGGLFFINYDTVNVDTIGTDLITYQISDTSCNTYSGTITIDIDPDPEKMIIYDGFSPNDDGINEFWEIRLFRYFQESSVKIYNRWGNVVYQQDNVQSDEVWNGESNTGIVAGGSKVPDGTYFYTVEIPEYNFVRSGYIIVRGGRQR